MNYLYIPELDNLAINMDDVNCIWIGDDDLKLCWLTINSKNVRYHMIEKSYINYTGNKIEPIEAVKYRLDMFFLNR